MIGIIVSIVKGNKPANKVELWITDQSLSPDENACIVLWGSTEVSKVESQRLQTGDVVRFNGVSLQNPTNGMGENTYYVTYSHEHAGPKWYCFHKSDTARTPEAMQTLPQRIEDLKEHYRETMNGGRLSPLPCRFRTLKELQVSVGLLSNISIRVQQHELVQQQSAPRPTKKRRLSGTSTSVMGFATVVDASAPNDIMTLIDTDNRFAEKLKEARDTQKVLMIQNVFTKKQSEVLGDNCVLGEVVLVPSKNSVVTWDLNNGNHDEMSHHSMPSTLETEEQVGCLHNDQKRITALGCLVDIEIAGKLLHESKCLESPASFVQGIMTSDQKNYRPVTLHLEDNSNGTTHEAYAGPEILQTLCGGIEAGELATDKLLQSGVFDLVQAMLREQVQFNWTIQMDCTPYRIEHVVLPTR